MGDNPVEIATDGNHLVPVEKLEISRQSFGVTAKAVDGTSVIGIDEQPF
jgi:hypothetical protein